MMCMDNTSDTKSESLHFSQEVSFQIIKLLQLALLTQTDISSFIQSMRFEASGSGELSLSRDYKNQHERFVDELDALVEAQLGIEQ